MRKREIELRMHNGRVIRTEKSDYRALIAVILVGGLILLLARGDSQGAAVLAPLAGSAVAWYFSRGDRA